jgi:hypothetical protein
LFSAELRVSFTGSYRERKSWSRRGVEQPNAFGYIPQMVTVHREGGFRFVIYKDDHEPAHVHVIKDGETIITLVGGDGKPEVRRDVGTTKADLRRIMRIVSQRQQTFLADWQEIHGGTD